MSSSNPSWLADAKLPSEIIAFRVEVILSTTEDGKTVRETNTRLQLATGTKEDRCLDLINAITQLGKGYKRNSSKVETNASFAHEPVITSRIVDIEL